MLSLVGAAVVFANYYLLESFCPLLHPLAAGTANSVLLYPAYALATFLLLALELLC